jgi:lysophospholipase L1-like esterase
MHALLLLAWLAAPAGAAPATPQDSMAFPGQWAPQWPNARFKVMPKACWTAHPPGPERSACLEAIARDFGTLSRYAEANAALAPKDERRVVFFGDSITDNWSKAGYGGFFPQKRYVNRGIGSQTTAQMLLRFRPDVIALAPRAVVILAGTNDLGGNTGPVSPQAIEQNLASMVELARANRIGVALASLLPVCDCKTDAKGKPIVRSGDRPPAAIVALNAQIAALAKKHRVGFIDYHRAMADEKGALRAELTDDGLHPNAAGYAVMAPLVEQAIAKLLR